MEGRYFENGAYRDSDEGKIDPEGFFSPLVLEAFSNYMEKHRLQSDGHLRDSDNWQKGMPEDVCMKSLWRHFLDLWKEHRHYKSRDGIDEALGGMMFNLMAIWHYRLVNKAVVGEDFLDTVKSEIFTKYEGVEMSTQGSVYKDPGKRIRDFRPWKSE